MGEVWAAVDDTDGREVAVKVLLQRAAMKPDLVKRFEREAQITSSIQSPFVCRLLGVDQADDGAHLLVFEQLSGESLADRLKREQYLPLSEVGALIDDVLQGLVAAHAAGVIHRDLKPGNIFVLDDSSRGGIRLLDFGLAKDLKADSLTMEGMVAGSPAYIAPEIWRGKAHQADRRIDVYSFATVIFRALAGKTPFDGKQPLDRLLFEVIRAPRPSLHALRPELPALVDDWVQKALAIDPADRFPTVGKMWSTLASIVETRGAPALAPTPAVTEAPWEVDIDVDLDEEVRSLRSTELAHGKLGR